MLVCDKCGKQALPQYTEFGVFNFCHHHFGIAKFMISQWIENKIDFEETWDEYKEEGEKK